MNYQVIFMDNAGIIYSGIWNQDRDEVICGCSGITIESGDFVLLHIYDEWLNITDEICGDDGDMFHEIKEKIDRLTTDEFQAILDGKKDFPDGFLN